MEAAAVDQVFQGGSVSLDCKGMANVIMARGLIKTVDPTGKHNSVAEKEFDAIFQTTDGIPLSFPSVALGDTKRGDWLYFQNQREGYVTVDSNGDQQTRGDFQGENVIEVVHSSNPDFDRFFGWPIGSQTYAKWYSDLVWHYNNDPPPPAAPITTVPGYTGIAIFFNVAVVGEDIFDYRAAGGQ